MPSPAQAGLFVYANKLERIAKFYEAVINMTRLHSSDDIIVLQSAQIQLLIHQIPADIAKHIVITSPAKRRENTALKFFFTVPSIDSARSIAIRFGGDVGNENWLGPGFVACNAVDPEGNVFQVRENVA